MENIVSNVYELRQKFMIIGLTGRTGSGCSTVASMLTDGFQKMNPPQPSQLNGGITNEERKYRIVYNYVKQRWFQANNGYHEKNDNETNRIEFSVIKASDIIYLIAFQLDFEKFVAAFQLDNKENPGRNNNPLQKHLIDDRALKNLYESNHAKAKEILSFLENRKYEEFKEGDKHYRHALEYLKFINKDLPAFRKEVEHVVKQYNQHHIVEYLQLWGENIRKYGNIITPERNAEPKEPSHLAKIINQIIKLIRAVNKIGDKPTFVLIDSLRNPFEVLYFRERYSAFYLMSITTSETERKKNLGARNLRLDEINSLDTTEYPSKRKGIRSSYYSQDIEKCVELSDIHIYHNNKPVEHNDELKRQLILYVALIHHPGLVQPTPQERLMQVAYTAKLNSGCISRQVGAVVTNNEYSVKAVGWNTVAKGQTPCSLRSFEHLHGLNDQNAFSPYELTDCSFRKDVVDKFHKKYTENGAIKNLNGVPLSYCFKDVYTYLNKGQKNQVHTRSLHAEENAFLQLAKYGSTGIDGGFLFTTASPCELCAKKAYQLGIKKVFYIDIYPGISESHILASGLNKVDMIQFSGAIGHAYQSLYEPLFPMKDEIAYLTNIEVKYNENGEAKGQNPKENE